MQGLDDALKIEINVLGALLHKMNCRNTSEYLFLNRETREKKFLQEALKAINTDIRTMKFADELGKSNPKFVGVMRRSTLGSMNLLLEEIAKTPSKRAKYKHLGLMPYDVERNWFLNNFNRDVSKITESLPTASENPEYFVKCSMKLFDSYARNIHKPYKFVYKTYVKNILGTNAKNLESFIEECFSLDSVYLINGRAMSDIRYLRKAYREKRYAVRGTKIYFGGTDKSLPKIEYNVWDLMFGILFMQMKIMVLSSVFCLIDVDRMGQMKEYLSKKQIVRA